MVVTYIYRKDNGQMFAVGKLLRITRTKIYFKDNETGVIDWYDRRVFEARRPLSLGKYLAKTKTSRRKKRMRSRRKKVKKKKRKKRRRRKARRR